MEIEKEVFLFFNSLTGISFNVDFIFYFLAEITPYILLLPFLYLFIRNWRKNISFIGEVFFAGVFARYGLVELTRYLFPRLRPCHLVSEANFLLSCKESFAYPSGHTAFIFAIATLVYFYNKNIGVALLTLSFLAGISRIIIGIHWPLDVFAGALIGIASGIIVREGVRIFKDKKKGK